MVKRIQGYTTATNFMTISYNVLKKDFTNAVAVTPGKKGPTVSSIDVGEDEEPAVAVSALVPRKATSQIMNDLEAVGATDILLFALSISMTSDTSRKYKIDSANVRYIAEGVM